MLPTGLSRYERGIRIRITKNRKVVYDEAIQCDSYSQTAIKAAKKRHDEVKSRLALGLPAIEGDDGHGLFAEIAQEYLDLLEAKDSTSDGYANMLNRYWMPKFQNWPITSINTIEIKKVLSKLKNKHGEPLSNKTKKNILIPLRGVLDHAEVNPNPVAAIKFKKTQKAQIQRYTLKERSKLIKSLDGESKFYFSVLFGCGLRPGEALALKWTDLEDSVLDISKQITKHRLEPSTKTSVRRRVYVPEWVRSILRGHSTQFEGGYIFQNGNGDFHKTSDHFNRAWKDCHKKLNIPYRIPYVCRHTRAAELLSIGIEPADAAKQLGHSVEMFLRIYSEYIEEYSRNRDMSRFEGVPVENVATKLSQNVGNEENIVINQQVKWRTGRDSNS